MLEDEPTFNRSASPCGSVDNPHIVLTPADLACILCGAGLAGILLDRARAALDRDEG
ncbi:MAG: hypothetical protein V4537_14240 [Pseudomonadota bacterium]